MYVCSMCHEVSKPGQSQIRHVLYFHWVDSKGCERKDIEREIPVCAQCKQLLAAMSIDELQTRLQIQYASREASLPHSEARSKPRERSKETDNWISRAVSLKGKAKKP